MQFRNFFEANRHAKSRIANSEKNLSRKNEVSSTVVDPLLFKYFFDLQSKVEKNVASDGKGMDYRVYARTMWEELIGEINIHNEELFHQFESTMIIDLHEINMEPLVYKHITENLAALINKYKESIKHVALWTTGDVEATGYQIGKIDNSRIIKDFHTALKAELPKGEAGIFMKQKTSYFVADDKFKALAQHVEQNIDKSQEGKMKIVIIEDSKKNFEKVKNVLSQTLGEKLSRVEVIPIWATYSREGQQAKKKAEFTGEGSKFEEQKINLNAIDTFKDLFDTKRFGDILKDAHVFVDFDGVIGDNVALREEQARVIYDSLMRAATVSTGLSELELLNTIKGKI